MSNSLRQQCVRDVLQSLPSGVQQSSPGRDRPRAPRHLGRLTLFALAGLWAALALAGCADAPPPPQGSTPEAVAAAASALQGTEMANASNFNGTAIAAGRTIWFPSVMKVSGLQSGVTHLYFNDSHIQLTANGVSYDIPVPSSHIVFDSAATQATTQFDAATQTWETVLPTSWSGDAYLGGVAWPVPVNLPGGINPVTWYAKFQSSKTGLTVSWKWGAAVYTQLSNDYNAVQVKPVDGSSLSVYQNSDHAGTPEAFKSFVVGGARGGGGSNWTGSWSNTKSVTPATPCLGVTCSALDACHDVGVCYPPTGLCTNPNKPDGTACDDGSACTQTDTCQSGACTGSSPVVCTALDQCHDAGLCDPATGTCSNPNKADGSACNDDNACTQTDTCQSGACTGANVVVCAAEDQCHDIGECDPASGACSNPAKPDGSACNDDNACTQTDTCQSGACTGSSPVLCTALDQCHDPGQCDPATGTCSTPYKADGSACNDDNACSQTDTCQSGACTGSNPVVCTALDQCHDPGQCDPGTGACSNPNKADGAACNDGNACTVTDVCTSGACAGSGLPDCDDGNACTDDSCDPASGCAHANNTSPCDDADACTTADTCSGGLCTGGPPPVCDDGNPCTADACDAGTGCNSTPVSDNSPCPDGKCQQGQCDTGPPCPSTCCTGGGQPGCSDAAIAACVCAVDPTCCSDQWSAACAALVTSLGCGTCTNPCDDDDVCTADLCAQSGCSHAPVSCSDGVACTVDSCAPGTGCEHVVQCPPGQPCSADFCASPLGQSAAYAWLCNP